MDKKKYLTLDTIVRRTKQSAARKAKAKSASSDTAPQLRSRAFADPVTIRSSPKDFFLHWAHILWERKKLSLSIIAAIIIVFGGGAYLRSRGGGDDPASNQQAGADGAVTYQTVLPSGKSIDDLGGWQRISPPEGDPVFAYNDSIDGISVNVSQQPLPRSLKESPDQWVADLAKKFNATTRISADGNPVYVGTSAKGPQSAIFRKDELLVLIKSESKIEDQSWATYARSLQ